jgi:hypothetical protein
MADSKKETINFSIEVDANKVPDLVRLLGSTSFIRNVEVISEDEVVSTEDIPTALEENFNGPLYKKIFNPKFVKYLHPTPDILIPVIDPEDFTRFFLLNNYATTAAISNLYRVLKSDQQDHVDREGKVFEYMYVEPETGEKLLRADTLLELSRRVQRGDLFIRKLSRSSASLLEDIAAKLLVDSDTIPTIPLRLVTVSNIISIFPSKR